MCLFCFNTIQFNTTQSRLIFLAPKKKSTFTVDAEKRHSRKSPRSRTNSNSAERNLGNSHFKEEDLEILVDINNTVKELKDKIKTSKHELHKAKGEAVQIKKKNARLKQALNLNICSQDDLDQ